MIKRNYNFITLVITIIILFLSSCATPNPMLTPPAITNKLLTIRVFLKILYNLISPILIIIKILIINFTVPYVLDLM
jgi:hypothetical protein